MYEPKRIDGVVYFLTQQEMEEQISKHWNTEVPFKIDIGYGDRNGSLGYMSPEELDGWDTYMLLDAVECGYYSYCPRMFVQQLINDGVFPSGHYLIDLS